MYNYILVCQNSYILLILIFLDIIIVLHTYEVLYLFIKTTLHSNTFRQIYSDTLLLECVSTLILVYRYSHSTIYTLSYI